MQQLMARGGSNAAHPESGGEDSSWAMADFARDVGRNIARRGGRAERDGGSAGAASSTTETGQEAEAEQRSEQRVAGHLQSASGGVQLAS